MNQRQKEIVVKGMRKFRAGNFSKNWKEKKEICFVKKCRDIDFQLTEDGRRKCNFNT